MSKYVKTENGYENKIGKIGSVEGSEVFNDYLNNVASAVYSHAEGRNTSASGTSSHAEGYSTIASGNYSHAEGRNTSASYDCSHAEGHSTIASGSYSHAEGYSTIASGSYSHAEGYDTTTSNQASHAEGWGTNAKSTCSHAEGVYTTALYNQHAQGHYNNTTTASATTDSSGTSSGTAFVIGNGTSSAKSNAFRVTYNGETYGKSSYNSTGADYAEFFEWFDKNPEAEDRRGYFVTLDGDKIKIAKNGDYILGIISGQPSIIGNSDEEWMGRYIMDDFGAFIPEEFEYEEEINETVFDEKTDELKTITKIGIKYKENPNYDPTLSYIQRADRPEWAAVGMLGVLSVRDDGTCKVNGFCDVTDNGIATASYTGYRVIKRINDNIIKVIFK